jgi:ElaB/YqjD/DUF883 family membrane-anchored ribosome-binding protein
MDGTKAGEATFPRHKVPPSRKDFIMSGASRYTRAISAEIGEIERRLRSLERNLEKIGARASASAKDRAEGLGDAVASAMSGWSDRFRLSAGSLRDQSATLGKDAAELSGAAFGRLSAEVEQRPLLTLAVAVGVGVLIGLASRSWDR